MLRVNEPKAYGIKRVVREARKKPCHDCGSKFPWYVMEFDHREGERKLDTIATLVARGDRQAVLTELQKCDLVCANCHKIRTHTRAVRKGLRKPE
jgi:NAD-dependent dihydropyrimidine dehydrogenase PreA subunit